MRLLRGLCSIALITKNGKISSSSHSSSSSKRERRKISGIYFTLDSIELVQSENKLPGTPDAMFSKQCIIHCDIGILKTNIFTYLFFVFHFSFHGLFFFLFFDILLLRFPFGLMF